MRQWVLQLAGVVCVVLLLGACTAQPQPKCSSEAGPSQPLYEPITPPVVGNGVVYIGYASRITGYHGRLAALRTSDGSPLWQRPDPAGALVWPYPDNPAGGPTLALAGDTLLLFNGRSDLYRTTSTLVALRASDGSLLWQLARGVSWRATPVVQDGILYTFDDNGLYAVRLADGQVLWSVPPPNDQHSAPSIRDALNGLHIFGPVVADGVVYVGWLNGPVMAVRASDGTRLWQVGPLVPGQRRFFRPDPVAVAGGVLYVRMNEEELTRTVLLVRTRDGHVVGSIQVPPIGGTSTPGTPPTPGTAMTPNTPGITNIVGSAGVIGGSLDPVVIGGTPYLGVFETTRDSSSQVVHQRYLLETLDGRLLWQVPLIGGPVHMVAQDQDAGVVFLGGQYGGEEAVVAVRMDDGMVLWQQPPIDARFFTPTLVAAGEGALFESTFGQVNTECTPSQHPDPVLQALDEIFGHVVWTRAFPITGR